MRDADEPPGEDADPGGSGPLPGELIFCLLLLMGSLVLLHQAWSIAGFRAFSSAGVFPMLAAGTMLVSGAVVARGALRDRRGGAGAGALREVIGPRTVFVGAAIAAYLVALQPLGFVVSSVLFLSITICGLHRRNYPGMILVSIAAVAVIYALFRMVFIVVLPRGILL